MVTREQLRQEMRLGAIDANAASTMFAGLNKTIITGLVVGGIVWFFFLRKK